MEIENNTDEITNMVFGSCFMMSSRNVIAVIDLHRYSAESDEFLNDCKLDLTS